MEKSAKQVLQERFDRMAKDDGLVHVAFEFSTTNTCGTEQICAEINRMYEAHDAGYFAPLDFQDSRRV